MSTQREKESGGAVSPSEGLRFLHPASHRTHHQEHAARTPPPAAHTTATTHTAVSAMLRFTRSDKRKGTDTVNTTTIKTARM